jgi:hypothetical protein
VRDTGDIPTTVVVVIHDGSETVVGRVDARTLDLALVDALARLQLAALRRGCRLQLRDAPEELCALLELVGLAGVLGVEPRREPEGGEQLGVEEVVQPRDPSL